MSYTTMLGLREEETVELEEFRNAHGSAMRVWDSIAAAHWPGGKFPMFDDEAVKGFWKLGGSPQLSRAERAALLWTYDGALCQAERAPELAALLREFDRVRPCPGERVNHVPAVADALDRHSAEGGYVAFGWIQTSVDADAWQVQDRCPDPHHDEGDPEERCPECGNERDDRRWFRTFVWGKDRERGEHFFIFGEDGKIGGLL